MIDTLMPPLENGISEPRPHDYGSIPVRCTDDDGSVLTLKLFFPEIYSRLDTGEKAPRSKKKQNTTSYKHRRK